MDVGHSVAVARTLREEMLRSSVPPEAFVIGPDYVGSVGAGVLDVYGDGALEFLRSTAPETLTKGGIAVRGAAPQITAFLESFGCFVHEGLVGMLGTDVASVPAPRLPDPLRLTRVQLGQLTDPHLPTTAAFASAIEAEDPVAQPGTMLPVLDRWADLAVCLFAAVDPDGSIQATAAGRTTGSIGMVFGVGTMPDWRRRGVATAMTAAAIHGAAELGATNFLLDATEPGAPIYRRLGFSAYASVTAWHPRTRLS